MLLIEDYSFLEFWSFQTGYSLNTWKVVEEFLDLFSLKSFADINSELLLYWTHYCRSFPNFQYKVDIITSLVYYYYRSFFQAFNLDCSYLFQINSILSYETCLSLISNQSEKDSLPLMLTEFIWLTGAKIDFLPFLSWGDFSILSDQKGYRVTIPFSTNCIIFVDFYKRLLSLGGNRHVFIDNNTDFLTQEELEEKIETFARSRGVSGVTSEVIRESRNYYLIKNVLG